MYSYFEGIVAEITQTSVIIDINGIGYELFSTSGAREQARVGEKIKLFTFLNIKEDEMSLYGFIDKAEKAMFLNLVSISGIGPKLAMSILGGVELSELAGSIVSGNSTRLNKIKGVGKKTAERIIVELRDKLSSEYKDDDAKIPVDVCAEKTEDAVLYLMAMGLAKSEAGRKVSAVYLPNMTTEQIVVAALAAK